MHEQGVAPSVITKRFPAGVGEQTIHRVLEAEGLTLHVGKGGPQKTANNPLTEQERTQALTQVVTARCVQCAWELTATVLESRKAAQSRRA